MRNLKNRAELIDLKVQDILDTIKKCTNEEGMFIRGLDYVETSSVGQRAKSIKILIGEIEEGLNETISRNA